MNCFIKLLPFYLRNRNGAPTNTSFEAGEIAIRVAGSLSQSTVVVTGRVTVESSPYMRTALLELLHRGEEQAVVVDLSGVSYLDMSGLATLLEALKAARQRSKILRVVGLTGQSRMLAEIAELDKVFRSADSEVEYR